MDRRTFMKKAALATAGAAIATPMTAMLSDAESVSSNTCPIFNSNR
ncbi:MAG: twin-arginine translocation signal domain-containing protein [Prevotella sp.]|nr:twin-arginine translocation signal domain-containing protein [Prevotella sp.]